MTRELYIIRHCKATGQEVEAPLTPAGQDQARLLADRLAAAGIERIVTSHFVRARATVAPLAERLGLPVEVDERLGERVLAEGVLPDWLARLEQTFLDYDLRLPGGETSREAQARAVAALRDVIAGPARRVAICSHGNLIALLLAHFDPSFGFAQWQALSNPDVWQVTVASDGAARLTRIWQ
jgi:2,3-bisphosphoglycerate-dependent phosphoglycerate mutase